MKFSNENEAYVSMLCGHLKAMVHRLRQLSEEHWDWTPDIAAPTARALAGHTLQWLICDRYHIAEADAHNHEPVPDVPDDTAELCDALAAETERWESLIISLTVEQLNEPRQQFNMGEMNVRGFVFHAIQNSIYKHGQLAELYFALGYDGKEPYSAPFPNPIYQEMRDGKLE